MELHQITHNNKERHTGKFDNCNAYTLTHTHTHSDIDIYDMAHAHKCTSL